MLFKILSYFLLFYYSLLNTISCLFVLASSIGVMGEKGTAAIIIGRIGIILSILGLIILPILVIIFFFKDTTFLENVLYPKYFTKLRDTSLYYLFSIFLTLYVTILHIVFCFLMCFIGPIGVFLFWTIPLLSALYLFLTPNTSYLLILYNLLLSAIPAILMLLKK